MDMNVGAAEVEATAPDSRPLLRAPVVAAYWFTQFALWLALLTPIVITLALRISEIAGPAQKASALGTILGLGAAGAMIAAPIWGAISDRTTSRFGRRKPWVIVGALLLLTGLLVMATATSTLALGVGWMICQVGSNAGQTALNAVMSDIVPDRQRGMISALLGASTTIAIVAGVSMSQFTLGNPYTAFLMPWTLVPLAVIGFVILVPDSPATRAAVSAARPAADNLPARSRRNLRDYPDFSWAFLSRFLVSMAGAASLTYQAYYLTDHLHIPHASVASYMAMSTLVMGVLTLIVSLAGGWLSDRVSRRKPFVIAAAVVMASGLVGTAMATTFAQFVVFAGITSIGQGLYMAVDLALCVAVLPDRRDAARDIAILQIANTLPQSLVPVLAPFALAIGASQGDNYGALFGLAGALALVGSAAILPIRRSR